MGLSAAQIAVLKTELQTDPRGYGYNAATRNDSLMQTIINTRRDGNNPPAAPTADGGSANGLITVREESVSAKAVVEAIRATDYTALPANPSNSQLSTERRFLSWLECVTSRDSIRLLNDDGTDTPVIANFRDMFAAGTQTMQRLVALASRPGSRAEEKFGRGVAVTLDEIGKALNS